MNGVTSSPVDIKHLLEPIADARPAGESLRYEGTYDRIAEARREDDPALSQGIYKTRLKRADWEADETICLLALGTRSKDLQIAGWLLEAWLHLHGFVGVEAGLKLLTGLCQNFWDDLYPMLADGDVEDRIAPVEWINQKLSLKLKSIALTSPGESDQQSYSFADWESARHFDNLVQRDPNLTREGLVNDRLTVADFRAGVRSTDRSFYVDLADELESTVNACVLLQQLLDEKCGDQSPSLHQFASVLRDVQQFVSETLSALEPGPALIEENLEAPLEANSGETEIELWSSGPIRSRADAYRRLEEAADYLLRTEPHSPTPYLVKRAVEWGNMNLLEVFQQIVRNEGELDEIDRLLRLTGKQVADMT
jgi:type VI secretion system ImpA family protein